jgi:hypothetical protein
MMTGAALLVLASLACNTITGGGLNNAQATANAVLTAGFSGDLAATADAARATADALLNSAGQETATPKPTEAGGASSDATETPAGAATDITGLGGEAPDDIPIIDGQNSDLVASPEFVSYQTDADYKTAVSFYKDGMSKNGWTLDANASFDTDAAAILDFTKDKRKATVTITPDATTKTTIILITISTN